MLRWISVGSLAGWIGFVGSTAAGERLAAQTFPLGRWYPPFNWGVPAPPPGAQLVNVIHAGLIPRGPQQGKVVFLTWNWIVGSGTNWGILDPDAQTAGQAPPMSAFVHAALLDP